MVVPGGNPGKVLVAGIEVEVGSIRGESLAVVIKPVGRVISTGTWETSNVQFM